MICLFSFGGFSITLQWHGNVCNILPELVWIEHRCDSPVCDDLHAVTLAFGWLWGSLVFEHRFAQEL